jgi:DNA/RNA endonuclease G (NUC1)
MRPRLRRHALTLLGGVLLLSCTDTPLGPRATPSTSLRSSLVAPPSVRFSEIHYDNASTDAGEAIEISGPAGTDVTGWTILLYNGSNGTVYDTKTLSGTIPATCDARGVIVTNYAVNGIQNGDPDGMALVDNAGAVIEFLSYEGTLTAVEGAANGLTSVDIGVAEKGTDAAGMSLARKADGTWSAPAASTFGACNDNEGVVAGPLAKITVTPSTATIGVNGTQQLTATGADASGNPVSASFTWSSSAIDVATVDATGLATGKSGGDATISATSGSIVGTASLHVSAGGQQPPPGSVHITEIHYDNLNTDTGEAIEITGPAGADLTGWQVLLYNGNGGGVYNTQTLSGTVPATCGANGVIVVTYPQDGIQNGAPDGMALVDAHGNLVEFLSYEGSFAATAGPANGTTSIDIGVAENGEAVGNSLQKDLADGTWSGPKTSTFGACNGSTPVSSAKIVINELMADPLRAAGGASFGEWFEVFNAGTTPVDMQGWTIASQGQPNHTVSASLVVPAGGYAVLGRGADPAQNGGISIDYSYFTGTSSTTIFLDATDYLVLRDATGARVDSVRWTNSNTFVKGVTRALRDASLDNSDVGGSNWGYSTTPFGDGDLGTPHLTNGTLDTTPPAVPNTISFSGRLASDPALPIGFEDQLFATERNGAGATITTEFTWKSETPTLATIDAFGVMHALAPGNAVFRATATDGTTATITLPTAVATPSATAQYGNNTEFGDPVDADPSDDFIIRRPQYTTSYNKNRGTPNWVAYDLDASQFGSNVDRCDCFTFDPLLPSTFTHFTTADYTGAGAAAGYGIDRGHLARSFDRTAGTLDNANTYLFSNIVPQASDLNQGPWANLENFLGDLARTQNKEVYIIAGVAGAKGTVKNEGKITIPTSTWKVAVIMPRDKGLPDVHDAHDLEVIAVNMPNTPGVRDVDWHAYQTTVHAIEVLSGYDLLAALPDDIENAVEGNIKPPVASVNGPYTANEGASISMSASGSVDPNGTITTYSWSFGDGAMATGVSTTHTYAQDGDYTVRLIVVDNDALADTVTTTAHVANVAPVIAPFTGDTLIVGETYSRTGTFMDPGADPWSAMVNYFGDGSPAAALALNGKGFSLSNTYAKTGTFIVSLSISDDDVRTLSTATVLVWSPVEGVQAARDMITKLANTGILATGRATALTQILAAAIKQLSGGRSVPAANELNAATAQLDALVRSGMLPTPIVYPIRSLIGRVIVAIGKP